MSHVPPSHDLISYFRSGDEMRSRSVSNIVLQQALDIPIPPARLLADWQREILRIELESGDVEALPLARTIMRWPDYARCGQAMSVWMRELDLPDLIESCEAALMACSGARYHHDGIQYGGAAFCNLFLSEDKELDLYFPCIDYRIQLSRGVAVIFDTGQPHAVIPRDQRDFNAEDFMERDCSQLFLTWELPIEHARLAKRMRIDFDIAPAIASLLSEEQLQIKGALATICPATGQWLQTA